MTQYILQEKKLFLTLLLWMVIGMASSMAALVIIPLHLLSMRNKQAYLTFLLGLWFLMLLSDSRQYFFGFAQTVKPVIMLVVAFLVWEDRKYWPEVKMYAPFIPFFILASFSVMSSPVQFTSIQKLASYFLLLYVIPQLITRLLLTEKEKLLKGLVAFGMLILTGGLALKFILPNIVIFRETGRFNGLLGNPNGLGIFTFCFLMLYMIIYKYHRGYFTKQEHWVILGAIALSLIFSGSRGGIFSAILFLAGFYLFQRSTLLGFIVMISTFVSYQLVMANLETIITDLNLQEYFRIETLEKGSGRLEAYKFARQHIQYNYWFGRGFGYTEYLMHKYQDYFIAKGHQGNVHNSYLTIWLDTGLTGLVAFAFGWLSNFYNSSKYSPLIWAVLFGTLLTTTVESWLAASLNPFTIQLVIIITLLGNEEFYETE